MGSFLSYFDKREKSLHELILLSEGTLNEHIVEEIVMKTYYNEIELVKLYKMFRDLNPNSKQQIKFESFYELPFIKQCAFKAFLPKIFNIQFDEKQPTALIENNPNENNNNNNKNKNNEMNFDKFDKLNKDEMNGKRLQKGFTSNLLLKDNIVDKDKFQSNDDSYKIGSNNFINEMDKEFDSEKRLDVKTSVDLNQEPDVGHMNFKMFCNYLKVFNVKFPVDFKIKFYFKLFDVDNDGFISKDDLKKFIETITPSEEDDEEEEEAKNDEKNNKDDGKNLNKTVDGNAINEVEDEEDNSNRRNLAKINLDEGNKVNADKIISILFNEVLGYESRASIEYDEFQRLMWITNIDSTCVIHL